MERSEVVDEQVAKVQLGMNDAVRVGVEAAYDQGFLAGKAESGGLSQADVDLLVADAKKPLEDQIADLEMRLSSAVKQDELTPFSQVDLDRAVSEAVEPLKAQVAALSASAEEREALEEAIADQMADLVAKVRGLTVLAPKEEVVEPAPAPEAPVEEPAPAPAEEPAP